MVLAGKEYGAGSSRDWAAKGPRLLGVRAVIAEELRADPPQHSNRRAVRVSSRAEFHEVLDGYRRWREQFLDGNGELQPRFCPQPMVASFMQEPGVAQRQQIPVPKGPVEVW